MACILRWEIGRVGATNYQDIDPTIQDKSVINRNAVAYIISIPTKIGGIVICSGWREFGHKNIGASLVSTARYDARLWELRRARGANNKHIPQ